MVYLDANPVIYHIDQTPAWGPRASARITALQAAGEQLALSDLTRMECRVGPLKTGDMTRLADFDNFFASPNVRVLPVTGTVFDRAALIRAAYNFKPLDSLHLAAAVEHGCSLFLTADARLARFTGIIVEVLR